MKIKFDKQKSADALAGLVHGTVDLGKKAADSAKQNIAAVVEKTKSDSYLRKLKKYNPVFPEQYFSENFNLPNMIIIVDDAVRRGIDVCEGAIGWLSNSNNIEILHLYDEFVPNCGLQFIPTPSCDAAYYVDNHDRARFIRTDCIFSKAHEERMAELKHIAYSLGAKRCVIEIAETEKSQKSQSRKFSAGESVGGISGAEIAEQSISVTDSNRRTGTIEIEFEGSNSPTAPTLKWFAHDDNIKRLIEMRCNGKNLIKTETLELSGASSAAMSQKTAYAIDAAAGNFNGGISMDSQAKKEHLSKLIYIVEF